MKNKNQFTQMAKRILHSSDNMRSPQLMHPKREWFIGLCVAVVFLGAAISWSVVTYLEYQDIAINSENTEEVDVVAYRESLVEASLEEFEERSSTYNELLTEAKSQTTTQRELDAIEVTEGDAPTASSTDATATSTTNAPAATTTETAVDEEVTDPTVATSSPEN